MSKRNKKIIVTKEARALKKLRVESGLSLRKLADMMELSFTRVHQMESGREDISEEYLDSFLNMIGITKSTWDKEFGKSNLNNDILDECLSIIKKMDKRNLEVILSLLRKFCFIFYIILSN